MARDMEYRRLGDSGLLVSAIGLGTNNFGTRLDEAATGRVLGQAIDLGVTFIDTADVYGRGASEEVIGKLLGARRKDVVLATKFASPMSDGPRERGASRRWLMEAVEGSLRRLATDTIDLYQIHRPDPATPIEETLRGLDDLVTSGKVRYVGYSNFAGWQAVEGQWTARTEHLVRPISMQDHFNLLARDVETDLLPVARAYGLGVIPYFPLESGFLTGKYRPDHAPEGARITGSPKAAVVLTPANFERLASWEAFAVGHGRSIVELALGWLLSHPEVSSVIAGASGPEQVRENVEASGWRLDAPEMEAMAEL